jgi:azurin
MKQIILTVMAIILAAAFSAQGAPVNHLAIGTKGDEIAFDKTKLTVKPGTVEITFTNKSSPDADMPHNFILVKPGTNTDELGAAGITAGAAKNFIPDSPAIIKATGLLKGGQKEVISVQLESGTYPYFCSYPGHAALMKGILMVK